MNNSQMGKLIAFCIIVPLAMILGIVLSESQNILSLMAVALLFFVGCFPLLISRHHLLLILSWNAVFNAFFLPGQPGLWMLVAAMSFFFSVLQKALNSGTRLPNVWSLTYPLLFLGLVVVVTAICRGGIGLQSFGSENVGAKRYIAIASAILGYFALSWHAIPRKRAVLYASLFFISGIMSVFSDLAYFLGPKFYWMYYAFPSELAILQATGSDAASSVFRLEGVAWAAVASFCFMMARYGARGVLDIRKPWRLLLMLLIIGAGLLGGFRSRLFIMGLLFVIQFCFEGLWRTRYLPIVVSLLILAGAIVLPNADRLPPAAQRSLSFLPVRIDSAVKKDADDTYKWRLDMWNILWSEVPEYLVLGKGYTFSASDYYLSEEAARRGLVPNYDPYILCGEYHSGPFSVILTFGIFGAIGFVWLLCAGWYALYNNYRYGDPELSTVNTFLLTFFTARAFFFMVIYGSLYLELCLFTGVLGLSVALNRGVSRRGSKSVPGASRACSALTTGAAAPAGALVPEIAAR